MDSAADPPSQRSFAPVSKREILARGFAVRCPNCGSRTLFPKDKPFSLRRECPVCGLRFERDEGFFLGSMSINYGVTLIGFMMPVMLLGLAGVIPLRLAAGIALAGAVIFPVLFYRASRSWWLMAYYYFLPHHLPANQRELKGGEDENT